MKRILRLCGSLGALSLCLGDLSAQTEGPPPLPPGPLLQKMADFSAVQITYSYPEDQAKPVVTAKPLPPPGPTLFPTTPIRQLTLTRTKPFWHALRIDIYGNSLGEWYDGNDYFCEAVGIALPMLNSPKPNQIYPAGVPDFNQCDFPDMNWISPQTYTGVETMKGRKCLVFKQDDMTVWIDLESRFPVQWQQGKETRIFQQLPPSTEPLVLPPNIDAIAASLKHDRDKWEKMVPPPVSP